MIGFGVILQAGLALFLLISVSFIVLYMGALFTMLLTHAHVTHIRFFNKGRDGLNFITDPDKASKERIGSIWMKYSGNGKSEDLEKDGFILEDCQETEMGPEKINVIYKNFEEFYREVQSEDQEPIRGEYQDCWKCDNKTIKRNSISGVRSKLMRWKIFNFVLSYKDPVYICPECQEEYYRAAIEELDSVSKEEIIASQI
jgi:hypothetical protein